MGTKMARYERTGRKGYTRNLVPFRNFVVVQNEKIRSRLVLHARAVDFSSAYATCRLFVW